MYIVGVIGLSERGQVSEWLYNTFKHNNFKVNFIEVGTKKIGFKQISEYIETLIINKTEILILSIPSDNVDLEHFNTKFDVIVHSTNNDEDISNHDLELITHNEKKIFNLIKRNGYIVINIDYGEYIKQLNGINACVITYGYNTRATITSSSIDDNSSSLSICQQRSIKTLKQMLIDPQEIVLNIKNYTSNNIYNALAVVSVGLVFDVKNINYI